MINVRSAAEATLSGLQQSSNNIVDKLMELFVKGFLCQLVAYGLKWKKLTGKSVDRRAADFFFYSPCLR